MLWPYVLGGLATSYVIHIFLNYRQKLDQIGSAPGLTQLIKGGSPWSRLFPVTKSRYINPGPKYWWNSKYDIFKDVGADVISILWFLPRVNAGIIVADPAVIKDITTHRQRYPKPVRFYTILKFFGSNIVVTEGDDWKKHRKITAPVFSERNNKLVWDETILVMRDIFRSWGDKDQIHVANITDITVPMALAVISVAAFGKRIPWEEDAVAPVGHQLTFKDALTTVSDDLFVKLITPNWAFGFTKRLRKTKLAFDELESYMKEMIAERKEAEEKPERADLFSALLDASEAEGDEAAKLTDSDLTGNMFIFLVAGHETTAHTLAFTFALLALFPDEQERLYQHVKSVNLDGRDPAYSDMNKLSYALAVFQETLRMFPPVITVPKWSAEDGIMRTTLADGSVRSIEVKADTSIALSVAGLHYNPKYWADPTAFRPSRFLGDWPRDAFLPFSSGARACLGRRFSETEGIAIIAMMISRYTVEIKDEPQFRGETFQERYNRILTANLGITLTPKRAPLVFKKRPLI